MELIISVLIFITLFSWIILYVFLIYTKCSKKYKNLEIKQKVFDIARNNKIITVLSTIEGAYSWWLVFQITAAIVVITGRVISNKDGHLSELEMQLIVDFNIIIAFIWGWSTLITNIYYILVYMKVIKANKI